MCPKIFSEKIENDIEVVFCFKIWGHVIIGLNRAWRTESADPLCGFKWGQRGQPDFGDLRITEQFYNGYNGTWTEEESD